MHANSVIFLQCLNNANIYRFYVDPQQYGENERKAIYEKMIRGFESKVKDTSVYGYGPWFPNHIKTSKLLRQVRKRY